MNFPVYVELLGAKVHPHPLMELLAYATGFQFYLWLRRRQARRAPAATLETISNMWLIVGCVFGAFIGSKLLTWAESWPHYWARRADPSAWMAGKTVVGGLLGGWIGVEIAKRFLQIRRSTGDLFVFPLIVGIAIGRVGCFLTGLEDKTYGVATRLPWGVNFGDGVPRHPTQLYEIAFLIVLGALLIARRGDDWGGGRTFRWFMLAYLAFRFAVEFIKPVYRWPALGLSAIQVAALSGACVCAFSLLAGRRVKSPAGGG